MLDLYVHEALVLLNDPSTEAEIQQRMTDNVSELKDEKGEVFKVIHFKNGTLSYDRLAITKKFTNFKLHDIRTFPVREDDVFVLDYAKSGTHWLCNLLRFMLHEGELADAPSFQPPLLEMFSEEIVEKMPSPRVLTSHFSPESVPQEIFTKHPKVIMLYRNPKDTAVSLYYHLKGLPNSSYNISWNCHVENWMRGKVPTADFFNHYNAWEKALKEKKDLDILVLCYEDMKKTPLKELQKVRKYLGLDLSDERLQTIVEKCSLQNLRKDVETGVVKSPLVDKEGKSVLYRKGIIGDWKNHFTVAQNEQMDEVIKAKFSPDSIYNFQYS